MSILLPNFKICFYFVAFWKEDVCGLLRFMENLKEFSFRDGDRMIMRNPWQNNEVSIPVIF